MKMHTLTMILTLITSSNAFAQLANESWSSIRKNRDILILQPQFAEVMGSDGLFSTCATEDDFKSLIPVRVCKEFNESNCLRWQIENVVISKTVQETFCTRHVPLTESTLGGCEEYDTRTITLGNTYNLEIVNGQGKLYLHHLFNKTFTIPNCE